MRQLIIVCEPRNAAAIKAGLALYGHPTAIQDFVRLVEIDLSADNNLLTLRSNLLVQINEREASGKTTGDPLICATRETAKLLSFPKLKGLLKFDGKVVQASLLCALQANDGSPLIARVLNQCDLSLRNASAHFLAQWSHRQLGHADIVSWLQQFGTLGKLTWLGEAILRSLRLVGPNELGTKLTSVLLGNDNDNDNGALCINRDARRHGKSGDTIANLITKRADRVVHESPATAIDLHGSKNVILFEDGLWSGTEAMGVIESLQGKRPGKEKTRALKDPSCLTDIEFTFAYGIATDYGMTAVRRFIEDEGLSGKFKVVAAEVLQSANNTLLDDITSGALPLKDIRRAGPPGGKIRPYILAQLAADDFLSDTQRSEGEAFLKAVGRQLFASYIDEMVKKEKDWTPWSEEKLDACALGMHGLGLVHAFGHSVPKATLPLIWGKGEVVWNGRRVQWKPLLPNA